MTYSPRSPPGFQSHVRHSWSHYGPILLLHHRPKVSMAYSPFLLVPLTASLGTVLLILYRLLANYNAARRTGLPIIVLPVDCGNPLWLILDRKIAQWVRRLPVGSGTFTRFNWRGWEIWDRYHAHQELGDAIFFVTPGKNYLQLCDAEAVSDIFQRRANFLRPPESTGKIIVPLTYVRLAETHPRLSEMLNIFGPNVGTVSSPLPFGDRMAYTTDGRNAVAKTSKNHSFLLQRAGQSACLDGKHHSVRWPDPPLVFEILHHQRGCRYVHCIASCHVRRHLWEILLFSGSPWGGPNHHREFFDLRRSSEDDPWSLHSTGRAREDEPEHTVAAKKFSGALPSHPRFPRSYDPGLRGRKESDDAQRKAGEQPDDLPRACIAGRRRPERKDHWIPSGGSDRARGVRQRLRVQFRWAWCNRQFPCDRDLFVGDSTRRPGLDRGGDQHNSHWSWIQGLVLRSCLPAPPALLSSCSK